MSKKLMIMVNGIEFMEILTPTFIIYGEKDKIPFVDSVETNADPIFPLSKVGNFPFRTYQSLVINQRFFAPKFD